MSTRESFRCHAKWGHAIFDAWVIDSRSAGLLRITLGLLLIIHAIDHLRLYSDLYSPHGMMPAELLPHSTEIPYFPSLLIWLDNFSWGFPAFATITAISYFAFTIGWMTRLSTATSLCAFSTICHRNPYIVIGSDELIGSMLLWCCLLPLGARFSVDSHSSLKRTGIHSRDVTFSTIASTGVLLQLSIVYFAAAWQKSGPTWWSDGTALIRILGMTTYRLPGAALLESLPMPVLLYVSRVIVLIEYTLPLLILSPFGRPLCRRVAVVCIVFLHVGIAFTIETGLFSLTMLALIPALLLPQDWEIFSRITARIGSNADTSCNAETPPKYKHHWFMECLAAFLLLGFLQENWNRSFASSDMRISFATIGLPWRFAAAAQRWNMFSPDPPLNDPRITVHMQYDDGSSFTAWDNQPVTRLQDVSRTKRLDFLWKVFLQKASLMLSNERQTEGADLRRAICKFFAKDPVISSRSLPRESVSHELSPVIDWVEIWVTLIPTESRNSSSHVSEPVCVARYNPTLDAAQ